MAALAPAVVVEYRDKLRLRLNALNDGTFPFEEHKFGMEIATFADRCNIDEELTRLYSHFEQCRALLKGSELTGTQTGFSHSGDEQGDEYNRVEMQPSDSSESHA